MNKRYDKILYIKHKLNDLSVHQHVFRCTFVEQVILEIQLLDEGWEWSDIHVHVLGDLCHFLLGELLRLSDLCLLFELLNEILSLLRHWHLTNIRQINDLLTLLDSACDIWCNTIDNIKQRFLHYLNDFKGIWAFNSETALKFGTGLGKTN